jgi:hypothetical protein
MDDKNTLINEVLGISLSTTGAGADHVEKAQIDEIQIPRRAPVKSTGVEKMIESNPALGRAWDRMEKNQKDFPYQEESTKEGGSTFFRAKNAVAMFKRDTDQSDTPMEPLNTAWIYGEGAPGAARSTEIREMEVVERAPTLPRPAAAGEEPLARVFLAFTNEGDKLTLELAWSTTTVHGSKMHERVIELTRGSVDVVENLREFRALVDGKRVNMWLVPPFFEAANPFLADHSAEFEPLHQWLKVTGLHPWCMTSYSVEWAESDRLTVGTLTRRFSLAEESTRKAKRAFLLLRARSMCDRDLSNRARGLAVAPMSLDAEPAL